MSSTLRFNLTLRAVVSTRDEELAQSVIARLRKDVPQLSCSPFREETSLENCLEFMGSAEVTSEQKERILARWDNDWDSEEERNGTENYWAYAFNTKMFDPLLYYLELELRPLHK